MSTDDLEAMLANYRDCRGHTEPGDGDLRDRYAAAVMEHCTRAEPTDLDRAFASDIAARIMAVRDDELERLRGELAKANAERDGLHGYRDDREAEIRAALIAVGEVTGPPRPTTLADAPGAVRSAIFEQRQRAEQAEDLLRIAHDTSNKSEAERARAVTERDALKAATERVRARHPRDNSNPRGPWCPTCLTAWPCLTIAALDTPSGAHGPAEPRTGPHGHTRVPNETTDAQEG